MQQPAMDLHQFTMQGMWAQMGPTARIVVIILAIMSVWSLAFAIERLWRFWRARRQSQEVAREIAPLLRDHKLDDTVRVARDARFRDSYIARVIAAGVAEYDHERKAQRPTGFDVVESARRALEREQVLATVEMRKGIGALATIATTAPFVGLFGTVVGIINSFRGVASSGSSGIGAVSAGIAEALAATALGLAVAIPAVWLFNYFQTRVDNAGIEMNNASLELVDYFLKHRDAKG